MNKQGSMIEKGADFDEICGGISKENMDLTVNAGDDFYRYACEGWIKRHPLRDDQVSNGQFTLLSERLQKVLREMIERIAVEPQEEDSLEQKMASLYHLVTDQERCNREGTKPIQPLLDEAEGLDNRHDWQVFCSRLCHHGYNAFPFGIGAGPDLHDSSRNIVSIGQGGYYLLRDFYLNDDDNSCKILNAYKTYIVDILTAAGYDNLRADIMMQHVIKLETRMARVAYPIEKLREVEENYHLTTWESVKRDYPHIEWETLREGIKFPEFVDLNVEQPEPLAEADRLIAETPIEELRSRLIFVLLRNASGCLGQTFRDINFKFSSAVSGLKEDIPLWKRGVNTVKNTLPDAVGRVYVKQFFPESSRRRVTEMVERMREAFAVRISEAEWMSQETREKALEKLSAMKLKIGYPEEEEWDDYSDLKVDERLSYFENMWNIAAHENDEFVRKTVNQPVDRKLWDMNAHAINACYNLVNNDITFPAGILQPPFFCADEDDAYNFGAIGAIIGHEMTHGFDDQGRRFDAMGNLNSWWKKEDEERFLKRSEGMIRHFDGMEVIAGAKVNGRQTLGENLGDNGGLNIAWDAFKLSMKEKPLPIKDGFTAEQRFFLAFALNYAGSMREETLINSVKADVHAPARLRVNGALPHIEGWYEAFNIKESDKLWLDTEKRVRLW